MPPTYKIKYFPSFSHSASKIVDYLLDVSLGTAQRFEFDLNNQISALKTLPYLYPASEYKLSVPLRKMVMSDFNYQAFYEVIESSKIVVFYDILHNSQDISSILKQKLESALN